VVVGQEKPFTVFTNRGPTGEESLAGPGPADRWAKNSVLGVPKKTGGRYGGTSGF